MIGVFDDPIRQMIPMEEEIEDLTLVSKDKLNDSQPDKEEYLQKITYNVKLIRDVMRDLRPDALVLEMCDERFEKWLSEIVAHPNYDTAMQNVHNILTKRPEKLVEYDEISVEDSNLEYLVAFDYCSYRLPCTTIMGDRSYKLTRKRFESKKAMLDVYKEASQMANKINTTSESATKKTDSKGGSIFDLDDNKDGHQIGLESSVLKL